MRQAADNKRTISQPGGLYKNEETCVDPDDGTHCEPPESVEPVKESQVRPDSPASTLRRLARDRSYDCE